jgi:hypothetical protein
MAMYEASPHSDEMNSSGYDTPGYLTPSDFLSPVSTVTHNEKEAFMRMVAQEMAKSFVDPNDMLENDEALQDRLEKTVRQQRRRSKRKNKKRTPPRHKIPNAVKIPNSVTDCGESFFGLALEEPVFDYVDRPPRRPYRSTGNVDEALNVQEKAGSRRSYRSTGDIDEALNDEPINVPEKAEMRAQEKAEGRGANLSKSPNSGTDVTSIMDDELSIDEIRKYVLNNIPQAVREQIPKAAWGKIFDGKGCVESSGASTSDPKHFSREFAINSDPDDMSIMSGLTSAFPDGKSVESKRLSLGKPTSGMTRPTVLMEVSEHSMSSEFDVKVEKTQRPKGVAFDHVEIRYYERMPTDNPAVLNGPAIGLGWRFKRGGRVKLDFWEDKRGTPLKSWELVMDRKERETILTDSGFSKKEVAEIVRLCLKGKNQRQQTVNNLPVSGIEEAVEKAQRKIARMMRFGKSKSLIRL